MSLQEKLTLFLNENTDKCADLMYEYKVDELDELKIDYESVQQYGGEDQGTDYYTVTKFTSKEFPDEVLFVKFQGWYASYQGSEYEDWFFVTPKEKTITVYEEL